ncbi:MAG: hypothetical protein OXE04_04635 [bacterium]|nr:hypothetical protein [bacterium]
MSFPSDLEIARSGQLRPLAETATYLSTLQSIDTSFPETIDWYISISPSNYLVMCYVLYFA